MIAEIFERLLRERARIEFMRWQPRKTIDGEAASNVDAGALAVGEKIGEQELLPI